MELVVKVIIEEEELEENYKRLRVKSVECNGHEVERQKENSGSYFWPFFDAEDEENMSPLMLSIVEDRI